MNFCRAVEFPKASDQVKCRLFLLKSSLLIVVWETLVAQSTSQCSPKVWKWLAFPHAIPRHPPPPPSSALSLTDFKVCH